VTTLMIQQLTLDSEFEGSTDVNLDYLCGNSDKTFMTQVVAG